MKKQTVGILGYGEIGKAIAQICREAEYIVLIRELGYDQIGQNKIDYLHINIPELRPNTFIKTAIKNIKEIKPKLVIINSTLTPGTTRKIHQATNVPIVHSPIIGVHPHLYQSIKSIFPKIIGAVDSVSLNKTKKHFKQLGLRVIIYNSPEDSETAKLLDLVYFSWNIIFCKWVFEISSELGLNFKQIYNKHNQIYNEGYKKLLPKVIRPVLTPVKGPIGGHCTIPDVQMFNKFHKNRFTKFILSENRRYSLENKQKSNKTKSS